VCSLRLHRHFSKSPTARKCFAVKYACATPETDLDDKDDANNNGNDEDDIGLVLHPGDHTYLVSEKTYSLAMITCLTVHERQGIRHCKIDLPLQQISSLDLFSDDQHSSAS
jgi:hypothetical protein